MQGSGTFGRYIRYNNITDNFFGCKNVANTLFRLYFDYFYDNYT